MSAVLKAPAAPAVIATAPILHSLQRISLWPPGRPLHRELLVLAPREMVTEVHDRLSEAECYWSDGCQQAFVDLHWQEQSKPPVGGPALKKTATIGTGPYLILGEAVLGSDGHYYPADTYSISAAVNLTLLYAREQALRAYAQFKSERARLRYEALERRCQSENRR